MDQIWVIVVDPQIKYLKYGEIPVISLSKDKKRLDKKFTKLHDVAEP